MKQYFITALLLMIIGVCGQHYVQQPVVHELAKIAANVGFFFVIFPFIVMISLWWMAEGKVPIREPATIVFEFISVMVKTKKES